MLTIQVTPWSQPIVHAQNDAEFGPSDLEQAVDLLFQGRLEEGRRKLRSHILSTNDFPGKSSEYP